MKLSEQQKAFEQKWHLKIVRPKGIYYQIPIKEYKVTAALLDWQPNGDAVFAILAKDYTFENRHWFTLHVSPQDLHKLDEDFEIVG